VAVVTRPQAIAQRAHAQAKARALASELEQRRGVQAEKRDEADAKRARYEAADIHEAVAAKAAWHDAETIADAATRAVGVAQRAYDAAKLVLAEAENAVATAATGEVSAEVRADCQQLAAVWARVVELSAKVRGAYLAVPDVMSEQEWFVALDPPRSYYTCAETNIGKPLIGQPMGESWGDPRSALGAANMEARRWQAKLAELKRGPAAASEAAEAA